MEQSLKIGLKLLSPQDALLFFFYNQSIVSLRSSCGEMAQFSHVREQFFNFFLRLLSSQEQGGDRLKMMSPLDFQKSYVREEGNRSKYLPACTSISVHTIPAPKKPWSTKASWSCTTEETRKRAVTCRR